jgi:hypothetical protein
VGVQIVGRWILARLRNRRFFSLAALNEAIRGLLVDLNDRPLRGWRRSRRQLFDEIDRPALLPDEPYEYAEWKRCRVNLDYHVEIAKHYYSVPHNLVRQEVDARITARTVEIFLRGRRVASHLRGTLPHRPTTVAEHMPSSHRRYRDWTHERIRRDAAEIGPDADALIKVILRSRPHPEQGFRSAIGIIGNGRWLDSRRLFLGAGAVLMRTNDGRVDHHELVVGIGRQSLENGANTPLLHHRRYRLCVGFHRP